MKPVIAYFGVVALAVLAGRHPVVAGAPFVVDVLPYGPPAALLLVAYLGWRINQSRILFSAAAFLLAYGAQLRPGFLLAEAVALAAPALPVSLAMILAVPEGRALGWRGLLRLLLALAPFPALALLLASAPAAAAWLIGWRIPGLPDAGGIPHAALAASLPLLAAAFALRHDRLAPFLPPLLVAVAPFLAATAAVLAPAGPSSGQVVVLYTGLAAILLHAILRLYWRRAYQDELTGLPNRRALEEAVIDLAPPYAVAMIDLDRFKRFNDRWGHAQGDQTLRYAAAHLRRELGPAVFRYGGEEFCALFEDTRAGEAAALLERARRRLVARPFRRRTHRWWSGWLARGRRPRPRALRFTISAGVASPRRPGDGPERVRAAADAALYRAKAGGRNRVVVAGGRR